MFGMGIVASLPAFSKQELMAVGGHRCIRRERFSSNKTRCYWLSKRYVVCSYSVQWGQVGLGKSLLVVIGTTRDHRLPAGPIVTSIMKRTVHYRRTAAPKLYSR